MGIQINGNTNNINAGIGSLSIEDLNELDIVGVATASNFKTGSSNLHSTGLTVGNVLVHSTGINVGTGATVHAPATNVLTLGTNSNERLRITSAGNIGINSTSPSTPLEIHTAASAAWKFRINTSVSDGAGFYQRANGEFEMVLRDASNNVNYIAGTSGALQFTTSSTEKLRITSDGNIGFNRTTVNAGDTATETATSTPKRIVFSNDYSNVETDAALKIYLYNNNTSRQGFTSGANYNLQYHCSGSSTHAKHTFYTQNVEALRIDSSGRLLVGQTSAIQSIYGSPPPRFSVSTTTASPAIFATYSNNTYASRVDLIKSRNTTVGSHTVVQANDALGELYFGGSDGDQYLPGALIQSVVESGVGNNDMPADLRFFTNAGATTISERLRITSSGTLLLGTSTETNNIRLGNKFGIAGTTAYTGMSISNYAGTNAQHSPMFDFNRSRGTSDGSMTTVAANDKLGEFIFRGSNGSAFADAVTLRGYAGTVSGSNVNGVYEISTSNAGSMTVRLRVDENGYVTKPAHPAFFVTMNGADQTTAAANIMPFDTVVHNNGGHYKTSGSNIYNFVCPVAGYYFFGGQVWLKHGSGTGNHARWEIWRDTTIVALAGWHQNGVNLNDHQSATSVTIYCDAGAKVYMEADYALSYWRGGPTNPHTFFHGHLIA